MEKRNIFNECVRLAQEDKLSITEIRERLIKKYSEPKVIDIFAKLNEFGILSENSGGVGGGVNLASNKYYYERAHAVQKEIVVIGEGNLAKTLIDKCIKHKFKNVKPLEFDSFTGADTNANKRDSIFHTADFFVVNGSRWNPHFLDQFNKCALEYNIPWLYVGGVEEGFLKIGPLFMGKETGCYNCLIKRIKSNHDYLNYLNSYENFLREKKGASSPDTLPNIEIFYELISDIVLLDIHKYFELWAIPVTWKGFITINAITLDITKHHLLKIPFCEFCKPTIHYNPSPWLEPITSNRQ